MKTSLSTALRMMSASSGLLLYSVAAWASFATGTSEMGRASDCGWPWLAAKSLDVLGLDRWNPHPLAATLAVLPELVASIGRSLLKISTMLLFADNTVLTMSTALAALLLYVAFRALYIQCSLGPLAGGLARIRLPVLIVLSASAVPAYGDSPSHRRAAETSPNIILISIDSLRADHLPSGGHSRMTAPTIERLAQEGVVFTQALAPTPWTLPSHLTLLTGLPPEVHGVTQDFFRLNQEVTTLPEMLRGAGFETAGFVSGPYLDASYGFSQGFDHYDDFSVPNFHGGGQVSHTESHLWVSGAPVLNAIESYLEIRRTRSLQEKAPLFLFVHLWEPHYDYIPPPPYDSQFDPDYQGNIDGRDFGRGEHVRVDMNRRDLQHIVALYDGEIRRTDDIVKELLEVLSAHSLTDSAIVVVTADHGEEFFEHGRKGHGKALYEESLRVPLVFWGPRFLASGRTMDLPVQLADVPVTLLNLVGLAPESRASQKDVPEPRPLDLTPFLGKEGGNSPFPKRLLFGSLRDALFFARTSQFKLIQKADGSHRELYDLQKDPGETANLVGDLPEVSEALSRELHAWRQAVAGKQQAHSFKLAPAQFERLRALGYLD